jgi:hypothetical protein
VKIVQFVVMAFGMLVSSQVYASVVPSVDEPVALQSQPDSAAFSGETRSAPASSPAKKYGSLKQKSPEPDQDKFAWILKKREEMPPQKNKLPEHLAKAVKAWGAKSDEDFADYSVDE